MWWAKTALPVLMLQGNQKTTVETKTEIPKKGMQTGKISKPVLVFKEAKEIRNAKPTTTKIETATENPKKMRNVLAYFFLIISLVSCNNDIVVSDSKALSGVWDKAEVVEFTIPTMDSLQQYNMFLHIRNTNDYKYSNLFIIAAITFPHGKTVTDTLEYRMANPDGSWIGEGIGNVKENKLWYKENIRFFEEGNYTLSLMQAVRNNGSVEGVTQLDGITDVGYSIEKANSE